MVPSDKQASESSDVRPERGEPQASHWPFITMAILVVCCLMCLLFLDLRIASLLCMAGCAVVRYLGARAADDDSH